MFWIRHLVVHGRIKFYLVVHWAKCLGTPALEETSKDFLYYGCSVHQKTMSQITLYYSSIFIYVWFNNFAKVKFNAKNVLWNIFCIWCVNKDFNSKYRWNQQSFVIMCLKLTSALSNVKSLLATVSPFQWNLRHLFLSQ